MNVSWGQEEEAAKKKVAEEVGILFVEMLENSCRFDMVQEAQGAWMQALVY